MNKAWALFLLIIFESIALVFIDVSARLNAYPAYYPQPRIEKEIANISNNSGYKDYLTASPGDTLWFRITVWNAARPVSNGLNTMHNTVVTDEIPAGIELTSGTEEEITNIDVGVLSGGRNYVKEYTARVVSESDNDYISNRTCVTAENRNGEFAQEMCNETNFTVLADTEDSEEQSTGEEDRETSDEPEQEEISDETDQPPEEDDSGEVLSDQIERKPVKGLPSTGSGNILAVFTTVSSISYLIHQIKHKRY